MVRERWRTALPYGTLSVPDLCCNDKKGREVWRSYLTLQYKQLSFCSKRTRKAIPELHCQCQNYPAMRLEEAISNAARYYQKYSEMIREGGREAMPYVTLSTPEFFCNKRGREAILNPE